MATKLEKSKIKSDDSIAAKSARGATFLIVLQIGSRAVTFAANQLLLRFISPDILGIATQLEVYSISVLFFARESLRVAIQRQRDSSEDEPGKGGSEITPVKDEKKPKSGAQLAAEKTQAVVNISYVSIVLGVLFAYGLTWAYLRSVSSNTGLLSNPYFGHALRFYAISAIIELLAEPCFLVVQQKSEYKIRASAEAAGTLLRCVVTCALIIIASKKGLGVGVFPFAIGQFVYAISVLLIYLWNVYPISRKANFSLLPKRIASNPQAQYILSLFSRPISALALSLFAQNLLKHLLTQGDTVLISLLASLPAQGIYALASNYGGLIARMVFQPIEESSRNYFGKLLSSNDGNPKKRSVKKASADLHRLLRVYGLVGICAVVVGPSVAPLLLSIVVGRKWTDTGAGEVLAKYCYYIPLLAYNGVLESFVSVVASQQQLNRQSAWMLAFSLAFAGTAYLFLSVLDLGAKGLVYANMANMAYRIIWCVGFIKTYLRTHGGEFSISNVLPSPGTISVAVGSAAIFHQLEKYEYGSIIYSLAVFGIASLSFLILLAFFERNFLTQCYQFLRTPNPKS